MRPARILCGFGWMLPGAAVPIRRAGAVSRHTVFLTALDLMCNGNVDSNQCISKVAAASGPSKESLTARSSIGTFIQAFNYDWMDMVLKQCDMAESDSSARNAVSTSSAVTSTPAPIGGPGTNPDQTPPASVWQHRISSRQTVRRNNHVAARNDRNCQPFRWKDDADSNQQHHIRPQQWQNSTRSNRQEGNASANRAGGVRSSTPKLVSIRQMWQLRTLKCGPHT